MKNIVVGINGGATSKVAADQAIAVAQAMDAHLHFVTIVPKREVKTVESGSDHWLVDNVDQAKSHVEAFLESRGVELEHTVTVRTGSISNGIIDEAKRVDADLIVVGNADLHGLKRLFGSVGGDVTGHAPCSVLVVKTT